MSRTPPTDGRPYRPTAALSRWLARLARLDPGRMVLGLERIADVYARLDAEMEVPTVVVAGTNGKGSCVHLLDALLSAQGIRVGRYTSPHLVDFRERIHVGGAPVSDDALVSALEAVELARAETALSYFEFATLAAFAVFRAEGVGARVLEVGLGGRLDAVNVVATDAALLTNVGLDHQRWLGNTREAIGREKAGVFRGGKPAVIATRDVPDSVLSHAADVGARVLRLGRDFEADASAGAWTWRGVERVIDGLDAHCDAAMRDNASGCLALLEALSLLPDDAAARGPVATARPPARLEEVAGAPPVLLDVAHNVESVVRLRAWLESEPAEGGNTLVFGVMRDKPVDAMLAQLAPVTARWIAVAADGGRPLEADLLARHMAQASGLPALIAGSPAAGLREARRLTPEAGRIVIAGSFPVVGAVRARL
ncbi:MAG: folylpolyglutamate synthase/dihydrofolate synthase family protein [Pseudomonadota bacterium]